MNGDLALDLGLFPLVVIDFEATSLDRNSYPIEVGVAIAHDATGPITTWSALIKPSTAWDMRSAWDPDAQRIHGIALRELDGGMPAAAVLDCLNTLIGVGSTAWCGDAVYDALWLNRLNDAAAPVEATFRLAVWRECPAISDDQQRAVRRWLNAMPPPQHRAGPDAERLSAAISDAALRNG